ncbi:MAG TPA: hypothetical protein VED17_10460 [Nitrososphaerales archaeon]|nr:hypothetical protein [Nitrososphaerales archaeon]
MVSSLDAFSYLVGIITISIQGYSTYWALTIRRTLFIHLYRAQALGIAIVGLVYAASELGSVLYYNARVLTFNPILSVIALALLCIFYWIDKSMSSARRSNPLLRDTAKWSKARIALWPLIVVMESLLFGSSLLGEFSGPPVPLSGVEGIILGLFGFLLALIVVPLVGVLLLPLASRRSGDATLRRQIRWFGAFALFVFGTVLLAPFTGSATATTFAQQVVGLVGGSGAGYALYRSAKSLVPLNKMAGTE